MQNKMLDQTLAVKAVLKMGLNLNSDQVVQNLLKFQISPRAV